MCRRPGKNTLCAESILRGLAVQFVRISHRAFHNTNTNIAASNHKKSRIPPPFNSFLKPKDNAPNYSPLPQEKTGKSKKEKEKLVINHYTLNLPSSTELQQHSLIPKTYRTLLNILTITPLQPLVTTSPLTALTTPAYSDPDSDYYSGAHILQLIAYVIAHITVSCTIYFLTSPEHHAVPPRIQRMIWQNYQFALLIIDASLLYSAWISFSLQKEPREPGAGMARRGLDPRDFHAAGGAHQGRVSVQGGVPQAAIARGTAESLG